MCRVHQPGSDVLVSDLVEESADVVVVDTGTEGAEEVNGLTREHVNHQFNVGLGDAVISKDTHAHTNAVLTGGVPVELLHAPIADEGGIEGGEVVSCADDGHARDGVLLVHARQLHIGGVVGDVHQGGVHHLVVHGVLRGATHAAGAGVEVIDEQRRHPSLLDDVRGLAVALTDQLSRLSGVAGLQLTSRHDDGGDGKLLVGQVALEGLALALATPDTQDQWHLDLGQVHEVLANVNSHLVEEGRGDVEAIL
mmetsp:Transcript_33755/g.95506  ORF Transcript_33755/g.95506 Transcript_33755/m.95506 type:complete len:252 (+) Transcript_33755:323-1078(+)